MAESTERLWMSAKERDRLKVLHEVNKRHITQKQAAVELGLSVRWVRKLQVRLRTGGDGGLGHGLRGRASNRKTPEEVKRRAVELYRKQKQAKLWHDYGPTLAAEELAEQRGIQVSRETLRQWLIEAQLWRRRRARVEQAHVWRARRPRYGELVHVLGLLLPAISLSAQVTVVIPKRHYQAQEKIPAKLENQTSAPITVCVQFGQWSPKGNTIESTPSPF